jgi:hypothetical protein
MYMGRIRLFMNWIAKMRVIPSVYARLPKFRDLRRARSTGICSIPAHHVASDVSINFETHNASRPYAAYQTIAEASR